MNRYIKLFALLGIVFLAAACREDEEVFTYAPVTVGDEVQFGASAYFDMADNSPSKAPEATTRTQYGTVSGNKVALNWIEGDNIEIVSPQSSVLRAVYAISGQGIQNGFEGDETEGNSSTTMLRKETDEGIRWGEGYIIDEDNDGEADVENGVQQVRMHDFYALYPAIEAFTKEEIANTGVDIGIESAEAENTAIITGYMPNKQDPRGAESVVSNKEGAKYYIEPDMRYAFMAAKTSVSGQTRTDAEGNTYQPQINLEFAPLVTALQFDITANTIAQGDGTIDLLAVSLRSDKQQICGGFEYDFHTAEVITNVDNPQDYNTITMDLANTLGSEAISLSEGEACNVTFFLLPTTTFEGLMLDITYRVGENNFQTKTATIGKEIKPKVKYFFNNLVLPPIAADATGSSWLSALDDATYVSQLSIPVASNAFTYQYGGDNAAYYKTQVLSYIDLWNMGIRGFELATSFTSTGSIADEGFVCSGQELEGVKFGEAFEQLLSLVKEGEGAEEFALVICKYQSFNGDGSGGYSPQNYVNKLGDYLKNLEANNKGKIVPFNPTSTIGDLRGKVAVLVRPADADYMRFVEQSTTITNPQTGLMTLIDDWGSAVDNWGRRYDSEKYLSEGAFAKNNPSKTMFENFLWGVSSSTTDFTAVKDEDGNVLYGQDFDVDVDATLPAASRNYEHTVSGGEAGRAMIQSFERIAPEAFATAWMYKNFDKAFTWTKDSWIRNSGDNKIDIPQDIIENKAVGGGTLYEEGWIWDTDNTDQIHYYDMEITFPEEAATYTVTFQYKGGYEAEYGYNHRINLVGAEVLNGSTVIASDYHTGYSGDANWNNTYTLADVPKGIYKVRYYCETLTNGSNITQVYSKGEITYSPPVSSPSTAKSVSLWLRWPESVSEKKAMIDELYTKSVSTMGTTSTDIYINSLSGFFMDMNFEKSYIPYMGKINVTTTDGTTVAATFDDAGAGGDYASCAAEMNRYFYQKIKDKNEGPYGIVIMDYLGATEDSFQQISNTTVTQEQAAEACNMLPYLIMMNNFKFPLAQKPTDAQAASMGLTDQPAAEGSETLAISWRR